MRYAVLELRYRHDAGKPEIISGIQTEVLRIYHTFGGAYEFVDNKHSRNVVQWEHDDISYTLYPKDYAKTKFDDGETIVLCSIIKTGFLTRTTTELYIQAIDELTQM